MTAPTLPIPGLDQEPDPTPTPTAVIPAPRAGSRAARMAMPLAAKALQDLALDYGVCIRPLSLRRTDLDTGMTEVIDLPCGATMEAKCPSCAKRARKLRQAQIKEGWHRQAEPNPGPKPANDEQRALLEVRAHFEFERDRLLRADVPGTTCEDKSAERVRQLAELDAAIAELDSFITTSGLRGRLTSHTPTDTDEPEQCTETPRRKRSTKRRQDAPDLPRQPVQPRTLGRTYTGRDGVVHQPSMWLTLTLDSYGAVHSHFANARPCPCGQRHAKDDPILGTPVDPGRYDYRQAAWDAVHFPRLLDRFWQNLRRAVGWNVQYAGCVEPQKRLAPHAHFAIRGTIARQMLLQVAAATYHQVWWPPTSALRYAVDRPPIYNGDLNAWVDPDTGIPLTTWNAALDALDEDPEVEPAHVIRFGTQVQAKGVEPDSKDVDRTIGYITKYVTKAAADCHTITCDPQRDHIDRLWLALRTTPCSERCANWLLYGIQPKKAHHRLHPGHCKAKVHQKATLGIGGRRILVSRDWSGKTLADHRHDAKAWVKALLGVTVDDHQDHDQDHGDGQDQKQTVAWELARPDDPDVPPLQQRLMRAISQRIQWRGELNVAKARAATGPPSQPFTDVSATTSTVQKGASTYR